MSAFCAAAKQAQHFNTHSWFGNADATGSSSDSTEKSNSNYHVQVYYVEVTELDTLDICNPSLKVPLGTYASLMANPDVLDYVCVSMCCLCKIF